MELLHWKKQQKIVHLTQRVRISRKTLFLNKSNISKVNQKSLMKLHEAVTKSYNVS